MKFCIVCDSIMQELIQDIELSFVCTKCRNITKAEPKDTMLASFDFGQKTSFLPDKISILRDPINRIVDVNCDCGGKLAKSIIYGESCVVIKVCENCEKSL